MVVFKKGQRLMEPDVYIDPQQPNVVVKDYSRYSKSPLKWVAWFLVWRETSMMTELQSICPQIVEHHPLKIVMERVDGDTALPLNATQAEHLNAVVAHMHSKRISHNDLHRSNVVASDGRVVLIDFTSAVRLPKWWPMSGVLMRRDLAHVIKIKHRSQLDLTHDEEHFLRKPWWVVQVQSVWKNIYRRIK